MKKHLATIIFILFLLFGCEKSIYDSIESCDYEKVLKYIAEGKDLNKEDENGRVPLDYAVLTSTKSNNIKKDNNELYRIMKCLVDNGANVNHNFGMAYTPLHFAAQCDNDKAISYLLDHGAKVNAVAINRGKLTPLHVTIFMDNNIKAAKALLEGGADCNLPMEGGITPLHLAVGSENVEFVELLLKYKANKNIKDDFGKTPLDDAIDKGNKEIIELLKTKFS